MIMRSTLRNTPPPKKGCASGLAHVRKSRSIAQTQARTFHRFCARKANPQPNPTFENIPESVTSANFAFNAVRPASLQGSMPVMARRSASTTRSRSASSSGIDEGVPVRVASSCAQNVMGHVTGWMRDSKRTGQSNMSLRVSERSAT
jgi:hypothetical protein